MKEFLFKKYSLELKEPFGTAHGTRTHTDGMIIRLGSGGLSGYGECFIPPYYPENQTSMAAFFDQVGAGKLLELNHLDKALDYIDSIDSGNHGAKAALDIALHDLYGKQLGVSVREMFAGEGKGTGEEEAYWTIGDSKYPTKSFPVPQHGTRTPKPGKRNPQLSVVPTSFTIGIDTVETMVRKAKEASQFKTLKIKLSGKNDIEAVSAIREITDQELFVDANQAWTDVEESVMIAHELVELGVGLIEQPFPKGEWQKAGELRMNCEVPVVADEDVQRPSDIGKLAPFYDGVNIKLMKCGGIREGFRMIREARHHGLKILLGCMTESSIGISAAAQLAHLADWCDLDGNLLIKNDTRTGVETIAGELRSSDTPGIGITDDSRLRRLFDGQ